MQGLPGCVNGGRDRQGDHGRKRCKFAASYMDEFAPKGRGFYAAWGGLSPPDWYSCPMTKLLEEALRQVEQLAEGDQDAAAGALLDYVKHMRDMQLTDAQVAEVRRRIADPNRKLLSHAEARARIERLAS